jgi:GNAT superfamily N-acetyltransferase
MLDIHPLRDEEHTALVGMIRAADWPLLANQYEQNFRRGRVGRYLMLVASQGGELVGMLDGTFDGDFSARGVPADFPAPHSYLASQVVHPAHQRQGIGSALVEAWKLLAVERGCTYLAGMTSEHDGSPEPRRAYLRALGMRLFEPRADLYGMPLVQPASDETGHPPGMLG